MGTKRNPGRFDCYAKAKPDEPMFVLLGRDPMAPVLVRLWAKLRERLGEGSDTVAEARGLALDMDRWLTEAGKLARKDEAERALLHVIVEGIDLDELLCEITA
jgi:hypothetical protein